MEQVKKLSLAELKEKANTIDKGEAMEKIQGGDWADCHGKAGQLEKRFYQQVDKVFDWLL